MHRRLRLLVLGSFVSAVALAGSLTPASAGSTRSTLTGNVPPWANSANFKSYASSSDNVGFRVYLGWNNGAQLQSYLQAVTTPGSASYGKYLSPAQFRQQYAPSQGAVGAIQTWLKSQGFTIDYTPQNNHYVEAEGTLAQASAAFGVTFAYYNVNGLTLTSETADPSMPSDLAGYVSGIIGLDQGAALVHNDIAVEPDGAPPAGFNVGHPCSAYWDQLPATGFTDPYQKRGTLYYNPCGYSAAQERGAYGAPSGVLGDGQTVAIIDAYASPTIVQDANQWSTNQGLPTFQGNQFQQVVAPGTFNHPEARKQDPTGWSIEESLDVESVHGMAPNANIVYVGAPNNYQDLDAALNHVVDTRLARIVTNSYGFPTEDLPAGFIKPYEQTIEQGAAEGIGIYFSSGDNSDESLSVGYITGDWPATSPWVTAVGGTSLAVGSSNQNLFETGWGTRTSSWHASTGTWGSTPGGWLYGAGGGVSCLFDQPSYQKGVESLQAGNGSLCPGHLGRGVPDVAADADPNTGYTIGMTQTWPDGTVHYGEFREGGTSLASPLFAGFMALADQEHASPHGFANPVFYSEAVRSSLSDVQNPTLADANGDTLNGQPVVAVVRTNYANNVDDSAGLLYRLRTANQTLSLKTTPGWDDVTGNGTPTAAFFAAMASN